MNSNTNKKTKFGAKAQTLPGITLAKKFIGRFIKYKYHVPHLITGNNTCKTHLLTVYLNESRVYGSSGQFGDYRSGYKDSKFNKYVLEAWVQYIYRNFDINPDKYYILIKNVPYYYYDDIESFRDNIMLIYNSVSSKLSTLSNNECGEIINIIVDEFKKCLSKFYEKRKFVEGLTSHPIKVKKTPEPVYHVIHQDLQHPPVRSAFYRRQGIESRKRRKGFHKYYYLESMN